MDLKTINRYILHSKIALYVIVAFLLLITFFLVNLSSKFSKESFILSPRAEETSNIEQTSCARWEPYRAADIDGCYRKVTIYCRNGSKFSAIGPKPYCNKDFWDKYSERRCECGDFPLPSIPKGQEQIKVCASNIVYLTRKCNVDNDCKDSQLICDNHLCATAIYRCWEEPDSPNMCQLYCIGRSFCSNDIGCQSKGFSQCFVEKCCRPGCIHPSNNNLIMPKVPTPTQAIRRAKIGISPIPIPTSNPL